MNFKVGDRVKIKEGLTNKINRVERSQPFSLTITSDGVKTTKATYINGNEIKETKSECNLELDEFDVQTGIDLCLERLGLHKTFDFTKWKKEHQCQWFKENPNAKKLVIQYKFSGGLHGDIGTPTSMKDKYNKELFIGDKVLVIYKKNNNKLESFVGTDRDSNYSYIMHYGEILNDNKFNDNYVVIKKKDWSELKINDKLDTNEDFRVVLV